MNTEQLTKCEAIPAERTHKGTPKQTTLKQTAPKITYTNSLQIIQIVQDRLVGIMDFRNQIKPIGLPGTELKEFLLGTDIAFLSTIDEFGQYSSGVKTANIEVMQNALEVICNLHATLEYLYEACQHKVEIPEATRGEISQALTHALNLFREPVIEQQVGQSSNNEIIMLYSQRCSSMASIIY